MIRRLPTLIAVHLLGTVTTAALFAWLFGQNPRAVTAHLLVFAEWDLTLAAALIAFAWSGSGPRLTALAGRLMIAATCLLQTWLYVLNAISNLSWDRNVTAHLVAAFA